MDEELQLLYEIFSIDVTRNNLGSKRNFGVSWTMIFVLGNIVVTSSVHAKQ